MTKQKFDIVIPIAKVDVHTFLRNVPYIEKFLPVKRIVVIGADNVKPLVANIPNINFVNEDSLMDGLTLANVKETKNSLSGCAVRSGWYFQQFLKMAYSEICDDEYYLIWDADTIPLKELSFISDEGKPFMDFLPQYPKSDESYFTTMKRLMPSLPLIKKDKKSYITEHMLINVSCMKALIKDISSAGIVQDGIFWQNILRAIPENAINLSGFSEFETYATYVMEYHSDAYQLRQWKNLRCGKVFVGNNPTKKEFEWINKYFDVLSIEDFNSYLPLSKLALLLNIDFEKFYKAILPFFNVYWTFKSKIRYMVRNKCKIISGGVEMP